VKTKEAFNEWLRSPEAQNMLSRFPSGSEERRLEILALGMTWAAACHWLLGHLTMEFKIGMRSMEKE
jgi:succinate dehydrogenase/fumarate reductase cytochrome b subunit